MRPRPQEACGAAARRAEGGRSICRDLSEAQTPEISSCLAAAVATRAPGLPGGRSPPREAKGDLSFKRVSIGVQDFDPVVQQAVQRIQSEEVTRAAIDEARRAASAR